MNNNKNDMHPDDMRNLILFMLISVALWFAYDTFIQKPHVEKLRAVQEAQMEQTQIAPEIEVEKPREEVIAQSQRISFENDVMAGSINLTGGVIDDLVLKKHFKTIEKKENVVLLSPVGSAHASYSEFGWVPAQGESGTALPGSKTPWRVVGNQRLTPEAPVTLRWQNGQGIVFERRIDIDKDYAFTIAQTVVNNGVKPITLYPYSLVTLYGLPEGYQGRFVVHEGPIAYVEDELYEPKFTDLEETPRESHQGKNGWIGMTQKYWLTALVPPQNTDTTYRFAYTPPQKRDGKGRYQTDVLGAGITVAPGEHKNIQTHFFAGGKKLSLLEKYEDEWHVPHFDLAIDFGWYYFLTRPFYIILNFLNGIVGNFGIAIILFTVVLRLAVFPLANTSYKSFAKLRKVGPKTQELRDKYKDDKQALQQALVKMYQEEKVNPAAGCLPIIIQIPIFFSLYKVLSNDIDMRHAPFFGWIQDLSAPDPTTLFNLFGVFSWTPPHALMIGAWPCMMLITMIIQRKLSPPPADKMQARMIAAMPFFMTFILAKFASGLVVYWTFSNLFAVIQQYVIMRSMGVEIDLIGNILGKKPEPGKNATIEGAAVEIVEGDASAAEEGAPQAESKPKKISKPKPKKSKKKK